MSKSKSKSKSKRKSRKPRSAAERGLHCMCCPEPRAPGRTRCAKHIAEKDAELQRRYNGLVQEQLHADTNAGVWITRSGAIIPIAQLSDSHLANIIALLSRKLVMLTKEAARRAREVGCEIIEPAPSNWERDL